MFVAGLRNREPYEVAVIQALHGQRCGIREKRGQPTLQIIEAVTGGCRFELEGRPVVGHSQTQRAIVPGCADSDLAAGAVRRNGVFNAILDECLNG